MPRSRKKTESLSAFGDEEAPPSPSDLALELGPAGAAWSELVRSVMRAYPGTVELWHFAGARFGWSLRLKRAERILLYLIPQRGRLLAGVVLGAKAVAAASASDLPAWVLEAIAAAPRYAEGTGLRLTVSDPAQVPAVLALAAFKMASG